MFIYHIIYDYGFISIILLSLETKIIAVIYYTLYFLADQVLLNLLQLTIV